MDTCLDLHCSSESTYDQYAKCHTNKITRCMLFTVVINQYTVIMYSTEIRLPTAVCYIDAKSSITISHS